jgi:plastocyanin
MVIALFATTLLAAPPARLVPPLPPADLPALLAMDPTKDPAAAKRMLSEAGVPMDQRKKAAEAVAKTGVSTPVVVVLDAAIQCGGTCGATRDLADLVVSMAADAAKDAATMERLAKLAQATDDPMRVTACRTIAALPADQRPAALKDLKVRVIALKAVPGAMQYDVKEVKVKAGEILDFSFENTDTIQHNLLVVTPGKMSEVGVAADKMGETAEGKAAEFVPDLPSVIAVMGLVDPQKSGHLYMAAPQKPGTYQYVCTYPGHWRMMNGKLKVEKAEK